MNKGFPEKTVFIVAVLVPEVGKKKLMIARIPEDDDYEKNRADFLMKMMLKCRVDYAYIDDIQAIRSEEELEAYKNRIRGSREVEE